MIGRGDHLAAACVRHLVWNEMDKCGHLREAESSLSWTRESLVYDGVVTPRLEENCENGTSNASAHYYDLDLRHVRTQLEAVSLV